MVLGSKTRLTSISFLSLFIGKVKPYSFFKSGNRGFKDYPKSVRSKTHLTLIFIIFC